MPLSKNDGQEPGKIGEREQNWDPLLDVGQRPIPRSVSSLTELPPFGTPEGRGGQSFFEGAHDPVFRAVEQPVAADKVEPGVTLAEYRDERDRSHHAWAPVAILFKAAMSPTMPVFSVKKKEFVSPRRALIRSAIST